MLALIPFIGSFIGSSPFGPFIISHLFIVAAIFKFWQSKLNPTLIALLPLQLDILF